MKRLKLFVAAALLAALVPAVRAGDIKVTTLYYYQEGVRYVMDGSNMLVSPAAVNKTIPSGSKMEFTALPPTGFMLDKWLLVPKSAIITAYTVEQAAAKAVKTFYGNPAAIGDVVGASGEHDICPVFKWLEYTLAYNANLPGYNGNFGEKTYVYTNNVTISGAKELGFSLPGYAVTGWSLASNSTDVVCRPGEVKTGADLGATTDGVVLYAIWEQRDISIALDAQGGSVGATNIIVRYDETYPALPVPSRQGHEFLGWFTEELGGTEIRSGDKVESDAIETLYARWKEITYSLVYCQMLGEYETTVDGGAHSVTSAVTFMRAPVEWARTGYDMVGWNTEKDSGKALFRAGATEELAGIKLGAKSGDTIKLYCVWRKRAMGIALHDVMGVTAVSNITARIGEPYSLPEPALAGFKFLGWSIGANETNSANFFRSGQRVERDDITDLYARWEEIYSAQRTVTFRYRNATGVATSKAVTVADGGAAAAPEDVDAWTGHTFEGWDKDFSSITSDTEINAIYRANAYSIVFDPNGGTGKTEDMEGVEYGETVRLNASGYTRGTTGAYRFAGWARSQSGEAEFADKAEVANLAEEDGARTVLYAVWSDSLSEYSVAADTEVLLDTGAGEGWYVTNSVTVKGESSIACALQTGAGVGYSSLVGTVNGPGTLKFRYCTDARVISNVGGIKPTSGFIVSRRDANAQSETLDAYSAEAGEWYEAEIMVAASGATTFDFRQIKPAFVGQVFTLWLDDVRWIPAGGAYAVKFDGGEGASGAMDDIECRSGEWITLPFGGFTREGWMFEGWSTEESATSAEYPDHATVKDLAAAGGKVLLHAVWSQVKHKAVFDYGYSGKTEEKVFAYGEAIEAPAAPERTGWTMTGWTPSLAATRGDEDLAYTATWVRNTYTLAFDAAGGTGGGTFNLGYGDSIVVPADPVKEHAVFLGWSPEDIPSTMPASNLTYKAQWQNDAFWVVFNAVDGSGTTAELLDYGTRLKAPRRPVLAGFIFKGWEPAPLAKTVTGPLVYTAKWKRADPNSIRTGTVIIMAHIFKHPQLMALRCKTSR